MGVVSIALCLVMAMLSEHYLGESIGIPDPPLFAILAVIFYAVIANVCYTGGWLAEIIVEKVWPGKRMSFGTISFTLGLVFSMLLTLFPGVLVFGIGVVRLLSRAT
jgi:hypothetical protein